MLIFILFTRHIVDEGIMLLLTILITSNSLCIKKKNLTIFHTNHIINIKERFLARLFGIRNRIMLSSLITILIPPINAISVFFQERLEITLLKRVFIKLHIWQHGMILSCIVLCISGFIILSNLWHIPSILLERTFLAFLFALADNLGIFGNCTIDDGSKLALVSVIQDYTWHVCFEDT